MREIYEKYYTVRLYSCPDLHFAPTIIDIPGEYDTEEEARAAAEPEYSKTCSYNEVTGQSYSWFEVQVLEHYKKCRTGRWKNKRVKSVYEGYPDNEDELTCSICEHTRTICGIQPHIPLYCEECGAKMEVADEE